MPAPPSFPPSSARAYEVSARAAQHPESLRLRQHRRHQLGPLARPARGPPGELVGDGLRPGRPARRQRRQHAERPPPHPGRAGALDVGGQRRQRAAPVVALPDQRRQPGHAEPGGGQPGPALRRVQPEPQVVRRGRQPGRLRSAGQLQQPGSPGHLDEQRRGGLVDVQQPRGAAQVADAEAAGAQLGRRVQRVRLQQRLDQPQDGEHLSRAGRVRGLRADVLAGRLRRPKPQLAEHRVAADGQPDLARQLDGVRVDRHQQPVREQPADRGVRLRGGDRAGGVPHRAERWSGGELVEHLALPLVGPGQECLQPAGLGERRRHRRAGPGLPLLGLAEGGEHRGELRSGRVGDQRRDRAAEPAGVRRDDVADGARHVQRGVLAPDQREPPEPVDRGPHGVRGRVGQQRPDRRVRPGGCARTVEQRRRVADRPAPRRLDPLDREDDRVQDLQGPGVQLLQRAQHGEPDPGPVGQRPDVAGRRHGEVGAGPQQGGERLVGSAAQPVGQTARAGGAHPDQSTGDGRLSRRAPA